MDAIAFRPLRHEDLPLLHEWMTRPHVRRWWEEGDWPYERFASEYRRYVDGEDAADVRPYVVLVEGEPAGYIQSYDAYAWEELRGVAEIAPGTAGIDILIADPGRIHRGLGPRIIARFLAAIVFATPGVTTCVIDPAPANHAAIRAYEKCGFRHVATVTVPGESEEAYLMVVGREGSRSG